MTEPDALLCLAALMFLGGCWQADGSLYAEADVMTPFHDGKVTETGGKDGDRHFTLALGKNGSYRLTGTDKDDEPGEAIGLRFLGLRGIPDGMYMYEAVSLSHCDRPSGCDAIKPSEPRYYGLVRKTLAGAEEIRPDCSRDRAAAERSGIQDKGGVCTFAARETLEKALLVLARTKPDFLWRLQ